MLGDNIGRHTTWSIWLLDVVLTWFIDGEDFAGFEEGVH